MVVLKPNVVRGGRAIGLGNNLYLMKGRTHSKGGIDIGKNPKTGLEVENNEVMQVSPQGVRVFSAQPILGGISPAQYILGGANPNQVFNAQEQWKKINRINDDGTKKAQLGKELYKKKHNVSLIDDRPEPEAPLNYDEIKRRQEFMESEFNSKAYNKYSGAKGRFQIRENALKDYIRAGGEKGDLFDSYYNEKVRDWIMEDLSKSSMIIAGNPTDSVKMAKQLAAYNWGRGNLSKFLQKQKAAGIDIYRDMGWIDSLPKETRDYVNFSLRNQDINDDKNNERYNSLIKRYGGRSRKKMFSNITKQIKQIAKQEENRNTPLPIRGEKPITPLGYDIASYAPIVGDAIQLGEGISDIKNRNYLAGAINLGLLALPNAIQGPVKKGIQSAVRKYEIKHLPGYQLKSLMEGNPLEKQLSKDGTISVNSIKAISNKGSEVEKSVIDKVLDTKYSGKKSIDYNDFRKSIQDELIVYKRTPSTKYEDYGITGLGFDDKETILRNALRLDPQLSEPIEISPKLSTYTFSSDRIPVGNARHYDANTLGHSRTYITNDEPDILHVMESQSDWGQHKLNKSIGEEQAREGYVHAKERINDAKEALDTGIDIHSKEQLSEEDIKWYKDELVKAESRLKLFGNRLSEIRKKTAQENYLHDNFTSRQIQENLKYAAEQGQSKMRYPTRETAAKIEGYSKSRSQTLQDNPELQKHYDELRATLKAEEDRIVKKYAPKDYLDESMREADFGDMGFSEEETKRLIDQIRKSEEFEKSAKGAKMREEIIRAREEINPDKWLIENVPEIYIPQHETILRKYDAFPKQYKKLFKDANVRTITDKRGNSWYEVDVPKNYLNQEWQYKYGGIHIKPSKRGTFTAAAKKHGMSVQGFASKVLANKGKYSSAIVKKANFARNASKWKHKEFGGDMDFNYYITKDNIYKLGGRKKALNGTDYLKLLWNEDSNIPTVKFSGLNVDIPEVPALSYPRRNNASIQNPIKERVKTDKIGLGISNRSQNIVNDTLKSNSRLSEPSLQNTIDRMDAVRTIASNQKDALGTTGLSKGIVGQYLANGIQTAINLIGNTDSYIINKRAFNNMRGPAAPILLRAEDLPTRVNTGAQEAQLRENIAGQENLVDGNLSSSRSRLNVISRLRNQGIGLYNQLMERKGETERELITRDKLNRQGIINQNIAQVNQWKNADREFRNKIIEAKSENKINLMQGVADAIAGERGFLDNLASNDRYRMTAFLEAIKNPDALRAMNSDEIKQLARRFGVRTSWLRSIGINI